MKPSPKRQPAKPHKPKPKKHRGRFVRVWLSSEFVTWAKGEHFKPGRLAECVCHTLALENPGRRIVLWSKRPDTSDHYDLPGSKS